MFTEGMAEHMEANLSPGISLTYFFNIRIALQFTYSYSSHILGPIANKDPKGPPAEGNMSLTHIAFDLKYYFNTDNVTRGLALLNPYIHGGFSHNQRSFSIVDELSVGRDDGAGFEAGLGIEIPLSRESVFIGVQASYIFVNFSTENKPFGNTNAYLDGDFMQGYFILGFNFM